MHFPRAQSSGAGRALHSRCRCEATVRARDGKLLPSVSVGGRCHVLRQLGKRPPPYPDSKRRYRSVANPSPPGMGQSLTPFPSTTIEVQCLGKPFTSKPSARSEEHTSE